MLDISSDTLFCTAPTPTPSLLVFQAFTYLEAFLPHSTDSCATKLGVGSKGSGEDATALAGISSLWNLLRLLILLVRRG
jgi:hypothetical protein